MKEKKVEWEYKLVAQWKVVGLRHITILFLKQKESGEEEWGRNE